MPEAPNRQFESTTSLLMKFFSYKTTAGGTILLSVIFIVLANLMLASNYLPIHDAIEWHGVFHYFYNAVERGVMPYWNPYSQTGTPFFNNFLLGCIASLTIALELFRRCRGIWEAWRRKWYSPCYIAYESSKEKVKFIRERTTAFSHFTRNGSKDGRKRIPSHL